MSARSLAKQGIFAEPASAASVAALSHIAPERNIIVCCTITGSALKYAQVMRKALAN